MKKTKLLLFTMATTLFLLIPAFRLEAAADTQRDVYPVTEYDQLKNIKNLDSAWAKQYVFTLQNDVSGSEEINISNAANGLGKDVYVDLNGHVLKFTGSTRCFYMEDQESSLTISDSAGGGKVISDDGYCVYLKGGTFTLESGNIENKSTGIYAVNGRININGGVISSIFVTFFPSIYITAGEVAGKVTLGQKSTLYADGGTINELYRYENGVSGVTQTKLDSGMTNVKNLTRVYYVTFDSAGGDYTPQKQIRANMPATEPTKKPLRDDGYVFAGWTYKGNDWDFTQSVTENITLVAKYVPSISDITVNVADGNMGNVQYGDTVNLEITDITVADGLNKSDATYTWYRYEYDTSTKDFTKQKYLTTGKALEYTVEELGTHIIRCEIRLNNYWIAKSFFLEGVKRTLTKDDFNYTAPSNLLFDGTKKAATVTGKSSIIPEVTVKYYDDSGVETVPLKKGTYTVKASTVETTLCNAASDIELGKFTIAEIKPEITVNGNILTVTFAENLGEGKQVVLALYNGNTLVDIKIQAYAGEPLNFSLNGSTTYSSAKVMVWKSLKTIMPLCVAEIVSL